MSGSGMPCFYIGAPGRTGIVPTVALAVYCGPETARIALENCMQITTSMSTCVSLLALADLRLVCNHFNRPWSEDSKPTPVEKLALKHPRCHTCEHQDTLRARTAATTVSNTTLCYSTSFSWA